MIEAEALSGDIEDESVVSLSSVGLLKEIRASWPNFSIIA